MSERNGGIRIHIPAALVAAIVSSGVVGGGWVYKSNQEPKDQRLRYEEQRRLDRMEAQIEQLGNRLRWLENRVYGINQRSELEMPTGELP